MENDLFKITTKSTKTNHCNQDLSRSNLLLLDNYYYGQTVTTDTQQTNTTRYRTIHPQVGVTAPTNNHHTCLAVTAAGLQTVDATTSTTNPLKHADVTASAAHCCKHSFGLDVTSSRLQSPLNKNNSLKSYNLYNFLPFFNLTDSEITLLFKDNLSYNSLYSSISSDSDNQYLSPIEVQKFITNENYFSTLNINIRSLNKNFNKLEILLTQLNFNPTVILVSETWIYDHRPLIFCLNNYNFINQSGKGSGGGAGIFIRKDVHYQEIKEFKLNLPNCEDIWIELTLSNNIKITVASIYRHPSYNFNGFENKLVNVLETINNNKRNILIGGDFNIDLQKNSKIVQNYKNNIQSQGILQLVQQPTRLNYKNTRSTLLDHMYTNLPENKTVTKCIAYDISDHFPVITYFKTFKIKPQITKKIIRDMKNFKAEEFLFELEEKIGSINHNKLSCNDLWDEFNNTFNLVLNQHAPLRYQTLKEAKRKNKPFITKEISSSLKTKQKMLNKLTKHPTNSKWSDFKSYRNKLTRTIEDSKRKYYQQQIRNTKSNTKKLWKTVNSIINLKHTNPKSKINISTDSNVIINDPQKVSNLLNSYFTSIGTELSNKISEPTDKSLTPLTSVTTVRNSMFLNPLTEAEILTYISLLDSSKSTASSCSPTKFIKMSSNVIAPILTKIFNKCIHEGVFPNSLKRAEIIPIFKKGDKLKLCNYRPISLLPSFSKIFERHLYNELNKFLTKNKIMHKHQYGFKENSSTEQAITQIIEQVSSYMEKQLTTCCIFIDLSKAFDTVNHKILLSKLYSYGIRGIPAKLITSYLTNRTQRTKIDCASSDSETIVCGVPQGSILGPLLFNLYINDLPNASLFSVRLFADDACLLYTNKDPIIVEKTVNQHLKHINNWLKINKLSINYTKTNFKIFSRSKIDFKFNIQMEGNKIEQVKEVRYLGVYLDHKLKWNKHIEIIKSKLCRASYVLSKLRHYVDLGTLKMVYYSLVYPHLNYCVSAWGGVCKTNLQPIVRLQKKILRIITFSSFDSHSDPLFLKLQILPFDFIYKLNLSILMNKIQNNNITGSYNLIPLQNIHNHNTRLSTSRNYYQTKSSINTGQTTFTNQGLKLWRKVPTDIKQLPLNLFKYKIKQFFFECMKKQIFL